MTNYVAYYRVSTKQQGASGLGLQAQQRDVKRFTKDCPNCLLAEYTEVESGSNNERPKLLEAIAHAKRTDSKLLIAKLDRLSRNAAFIFLLRDSGVSFTCVDMPEANHLTISIMAVLAEDERKRISERTRKALAEKKAQGVKLGNPNGFTDIAQKKATETKKLKAANNKNTQTAKKYLLRLFKFYAMEGNRLTMIKAITELNDANMKTARGKDFTRGNIQYIFEQAKREFKSKAA